MGIEGREAQASQEVLRAQEARAQLAYDVNFKLGKLDKIPQLLRIGRLLPELRRLQLHKDEIDLCNNESIWGKQVVKGAEQLGKNKRVPKELAGTLRALGLRAMYEGVRGAEQALAEHPDFEGRQFLVDRLGRFKGDYLMQSGQYNEALILFNESARRFEASEEPVVSVNALEQHGFAAEAETMLGMWEKGYAREVAAFDAFDGDKYQAWSEEQKATKFVWQSGGLIKFMRALLATNQDRLVPKSIRDDLLRRLEKCKVESQILTSTLNSDEVGGLAVRIGEIDELEIVLKQRDWKFPMATVGR